MNQNNGSKLASYVLCVSKAFEQVVASLVATGVLPSTYN